MRKSTKIVKKLLALFLVVLISINTLGAIVSDNDGSAFITKAEFDSLKNNFQAQIDQYNTSIDSKIDGAISSYLAGIQIEKKTILKNTYEQLGYRVLWGNIPFVSTDLKHHLYAFAALMWQGDGYGPRNPVSGQTKYEVYYRYSAGGITDTSGTGTYNLFQKIDNKYYYYGSTTNEYCGNNYSFFGDLLFDWGVNDTYNHYIDDAVYPAGAQLMSYNNKPNDVSAYPWQTASSTINWVQTRSYVGWSAKQTYWTRADIYYNGSVTNKRGYMAAGAIANTIDRSIDYENRTGGKVSSEDYVRSDFSATKTLNWCLSRRISNHNIAGASTEPFCEEEMVYFYPQTYNINRCDLHSLLAKNALNRDIKLYEGLPFFEATADGTVKLSFTLNTNNSAASTVKFYLNDSIMFNNATPVGNQKFDVWKVASDKSKTKIGTDVTSISVDRNTNIEIEFEVKKDHEYIFKLAPSNLSYYAFIENFSDIVQTEE